MDALRVQLYYMTHLEHNCQSICGKKIKHVFCAH